MSSIAQIIEHEIQRWNVEQRRLRAAETAKPGRPQPLRPWIAISRECGSGGTDIARRVAVALEYHVYDREIVDEIARTSEFRRATLQALDERVQSGISLYLDGLIRGRLLDRSDYCRHLVEVVVGIAHHGNAVLVGRGSPFILDPSEGLRVRIAAPLEWRAQSLVSRLEVSKEKALKLARVSDEERAEFIKRTFGRDPNDPTGYDLTLNTAALGPATAAHLIQVALREKMARRMGVEIGPD